MLAGLALNAGAVDLRVAVAANFSDVLAALAPGYEASTGNTITSIPGSSGKHYAQIRNGAPVDAFLSADARRPALLEQAGIGVTGTRFTYASGRLALWAPAAASADTVRARLESGDYEHLAIANPRLAPYGAAALETLQNMGLWDAARSRIVTGENVGQAFHFVASGNAGLGFVALSQVKHPGVATRGAAWIVPEWLHAPIEQQALLIRDSEAGRAFMTYLAGARARSVIRDYGYRAP